jgi:ATP-dependent RNA helicase DDX41
MVASGVASKGLDFIDIQHVIIFSMPKEIEDYVHQIGRTGRSGKTGIATTFVNMNTPEQTLLDLKYLLMEAGQKYDLLRQPDASLFPELYFAEFLHSYRP